jgi:tetratricopeptide (TPR) repeat protein/Cdc6-like AAA superfamily ATPase
VLYTSLSAPAAGFAPVEGEPRISEHQPPLELFSLPRVESTFQGRQDELREIGSRLTGDNRPRLLTIHGSGGQGKTALAREAVERFAHAFPGGVVAVSLENLPTREQVIADLARFLGIDMESIADLAERERQVLTRLGQRRTLLVLDNAETLIQQVQAEDEQALNLADFLRYTLPNTQTTLLATSRNIFGWTGEEILHLEGLRPADARHLFRDNVIRRSSAANDETADRDLWTLCERVYGHPLSLRLLGSAFDQSDLTLVDFITQYEQEVLHAEDKYRHLDHRHRSVHASIETSVRFLDDDLRALLGGLWVFHAPFQPEAAVAIFDPDTEYPEGQHSPVSEQLYRLALRSLLEIETVTTSAGQMQFYRLHPTMRLFAEQHMQPSVAQDELLQRFGAAYYNLAETLYRGIDFGVAQAIVAQRCANDLDRGMKHAPAAQQGWYALYRGRVLHTLGDPHRGLALTKQADAAAGNDNQELKRVAQYNMALMYSAMGQLQQALQLSNQTLRVMQAVDDRAGEAATLNNIAGIYSAMGKPQRALELYEQALPIRREVGDRAGEAATLSNMGEVYRTMGQPQQALPQLKEALSIRREVGDRAGEAAILNNLAAAYQSIGKLQEAQHYYQQSLSISRELQDLSREATVLNNLAVVLTMMGKPQQALMLLEKALPIQNKVGNPAGEAATLVSIGDVYQVTGQLQKALASYEQAMHITENVGNQAGVATALYKLGGIYVTLGERERALQLYERALFFWREIKGRSGEAVTLMSMAGTYEATGEVWKALEYYEHALSMTEEKEMDDLRNQATALNGIGEIYLAVGQAQQALTYFESALSKRRKVADRAGEATTLNNIGEVYRISGEPQQARQRYDKALSIRRDVGDRAGEAAVLNNIALVSQAIGQPQQALNLFEQILSITREVGDRAGEAQTLNNLAAMYLIIGQAPQAQMRFEQALSIRHEIDDQMGAATTLHNIGWLYHTTGQVQQALKYYDQALSKRRKIGDSAGEAETLGLLAGLNYQHLHRPEEAAEYLKQAIALLETAGLDRTPSGTTLTMMQEWLAAIQPLKQMHTEMKSQDTLWQKVRKFFGNK